MKNFPGPVLWQKKMLAVIIHVFALIRPSCVRYPILLGVRKSTFGVRITNLVFMLGEKLYPDFFLDEAEEASKLLYQKKMSSQGSPSSQQAPSSDSPEGIFAGVKSMLSEDIVKRVNGTFLFVLSGEHGGSWLLDLKNGAGSVSKCSEDTAADVTMMMNSDNMVAMFMGKLSPTSAFMTGKLKVAGNMALAMKLETLMGQMRPKL